MCSFHLTQSDCDKVIRLIRCFTFVRRRKIVSASSVPGINILFICVCVSIWTNWSLNYFPAVGPPRWKRRRFSKRFNPSEPLSGIWPVWPSCPHGSLLSLPREEWLLISNYGTCCKNAERYLNEEKKRRGSVRAQFNWKTLFGIAAVPAFPYSSFFGKLNSIRLTFSSNHIVFVLALCAIHTTIHPNPCPIPPTQWWSSDATMHWAGTHCSPAPMKSHIR